MGKKILVQCEHCKIERNISPTGKKTPSPLCGSCAAKKRFGSLDLHTKEVWKSPCKKCGVIRTYCRIKTWKQRRELCVSCSQIKTDDHYNRAYQNYKGKVWSETNRQPLHLLEHYEKRGRSGRKGAYQLDHIIPIKYGFDNNIPIEVIGNIKNLQIIKWEDNIKKSCKYKP